MNHLCYIFILFFISLSCNHYNKPQPSVPDGGDCSYKTTNIPATIIEIYQTDSGYSEIILVAAHENNPADTLYYSDNFGGHINNDTLKKYNYKPGDKWTYQYKEIIDGSCTPEIYMLTTENYK